MYIRFPDRRTHTLKSFGIAFTAALTVMPACQSGRQRNALDLAELGIAAGYFDVYNSLTTLSYSITNLEYVVRSPW